MLPVAPTMFSMISPWPNAFWKCALTSRAMPSVALPAGNGTIVRIGLFG